MNKAGREAVLRLINCSGAFPPAEREGLCREAENLLQEDETKPLLIFSRRHPRGHTLEALTLNALLVDTHSAKRPVMMNTALTKLICPENGDVTADNCRQLLLTAAALGSVVSLNAPRRLRHVRADCRGCRACGRGGSRALYADARCVWERFGSAMTQERNACFRFFLLTEGQNRVTRMQNCFRGGFLERNRWRRFLRLFFR
ncbi:MAG: hypothetical protein FWF47_05445 [Clostridia bacterium]|nr:hypothetical protein [Clostridia bacterium]